MSAFGMLNINKPAGPTSHDIVAGVRRGTRVKKVGHAGTLDPMATGVLVVCLGAATRLSQYAMGSRKTYLARVRFGIETDTYDAGGIITAENDAPLGREAIEAALDAFRGDIEQVPPMYSAIKQDGQKLYELARAGQDVERAARPVTIHNLELITWEPPCAALRVECSAGTYIRSLAFDLGRAVGVGAHLAALERAASGPFTVEDAVTWDDLQAAMAAGTWREYLLPPDMALAHYPRLDLTAEESEDIRHGRLIPADTEREFAGDLARAYDPEGRFFAIVEQRGIRWKAHKVLSS